VNNSQRIERTALGYAHIRADIAADNSLSASEKRCLHALIACSQREKTFTLADFAARLRIPEDTLASILARLRARGYGQWEESVLGAREDA
jgi:hypothetical protein